MSGTSGWDVCRGTNSLWVVISGRGTRPARSTSESADAEAGDWDDAMAFYRPAVGVAPGFESAWFNMALIHKWRRE
jgi:hypothetical protein